MLPGMQGSVTETEAGSDERHWLELTLHELAAIVRSAGKDAVLYCAACRDGIAYDRVVVGPIREWPYCPNHPERPLLIRSAPLYGPASGTTFVFTAPASTVNTTVGSAPEVSASRKAP